MLIAVSNNPLIGPKRDELERIMAREENEAKCFRRTLTVGRRPTEKIQEHFWMDPATDSEVG